MLSSKLLEVIVEKYVIIVAGGKGERMHSSIPKQFMLLNEQPLLMHTIRAFYLFDSSVVIILVLPEAQKSYWQDLCRKHEFDVPHTLVDGGATRFHSVQCGLALVPHNCLVAVHDGVRPFVSPDTIDACYEAAKNYVAVVPVVESVDSLRYIDENGENRALVRAQCKLVQTPQVFHSSLLLMAYKQAYSDNFTDDASVVEALGEKIHLVQGNVENIKITSPSDLLIAQALFSQK